MTETCPAIWNVLHDATLVGIEGAVPGNLRLKLECDYLRERFDEPGGWILSADVTENFCKVHCSQHRTETTGGGELEVSATSVELLLDSGRVVSLKEIETVADAYWTEWEASNAARRENPSQ